MLYESIKVFKLEELEEPNLFLLDDRKASSDAKYVVCIMCKKKKFLEYFNQSDSLHTVYNCNLQSIKIL